MAPKRRDGDAAAGRKRRRIQKEFLLPNTVPGYCFTLGTNGFGALGLGEDVTEKLRAAKVDVAGKRLLSVVCGGMHTVALAEDGTVYTWGVNDEGALGRPTSGTAWESEPESRKEDPYVPGEAKMPDGVFIVQIVAGDGFTFALSDQGAIYGWGQFKDDLSSFYSFTPDVKVQRLPVLVYEAPDIRDRARKLAAGARHMVALTRRGDVLTWGIGGQGQLGRLAPFNQDSYPAAEALLTPKPISKQLAAAIGSDVIDIGAGNYSTYAINKRGAVAAWGLNNGGQLALPVADNKDAEQCVWQPTAVPNLSEHSIAAVAGGEHHSLALTRKHQVLSFGSSNYGMLGRSDIPQPEGTETICIPESAPVDQTDGLEDEQPFSIAAGVHVSACVTSNGQLFTWGSNVNYQMAKGQDESDNLVPTRMRRHKAFGNRKVLQFSFGGQHAALLATEDLSTDNGGSIQHPTPPPADAADAAAAGPSTSAVAAAPPAEKAVTAAETAAAATGAQQEQQDEQPATNGALAPAHGKRARKEAASDKAQPAAKKSAGPNGATANKADKAAAVTNNAPAAKRGRRA